MRYKAWISAVILTSALLLAGCGQPEAQLEDDAGVTLGEIEDMSLEDQYEVAGERYTQFNEFFGEVQTNISANDWIDTGVGSEIVPRMGSSLGRAPEGTTRDNSYYFTVARRYKPDEDLPDVMQRVADSWQARGWNLGEQNTQVSSARRLTALTPRRALVRPWERPHDPRASTHRPLPSLLG